MKYILEYTAKADSQLRRIANIDAKRITEKLDYYCKLADPLIDSKPLTGKLSGLYRFRIGKYRVIFSKNSNGEFVILMILRIGKRDDIYKD